MDRPYILVPRAEIGLDPVVRNANGSPRPKVDLPAAYVTHHWTGVNVNFGDIGDTIAEILAIEAYAQSAGKPNEYNYVNHMDPDNKVFEYAGQYRAAHSAGENSIALGILHLLGIREVISLLMVDKIRWLNTVFAHFGMRDAGTMDRGHRQMPGGVTACPGDIISWWIPEMSRLIVPEPAPVPTPPPPTPAPSPVPTPPPPVPVQPPDSSRSGMYLVTDRKTPWSISAEVYGTGTKWSEIMAANAPDTTPNPLERWAVPGFSGIWTEVKSGEGPWQILNRIFGSDGWNKATGVDEFWQWNGGNPDLGGRMFNGKKIALQPGERVWVRN